MTEQLTEEDLAIIERRLNHTPVEGPSYQYYGNLRRLLEDDLAALLHALRASREQVRVLRTALLGIHAIYSRKADHLEAYRPLLQLVKAALAATAAPSGQEAGE